MTYKEALNLYKQAGRMSFGGARFSSSQTNMPLKRQKGSSTSSQRRHDPPVIPNIPATKPRYTTRVIDKPQYPNESVQNHPFYAGKPKPRRPPKFKRVNVTRYQLPSGQWVETSAPVGRIGTVTETPLRVIPHNPISFYRSGALIPGYQGKFKDVPTQVAVKPRKTEVMPSKVVVTRKYTPRLSPLETWFSGGNSTPEMTITGDSGPFEDVPDPRIAQRRRIERGLEAVPLWNYADRVHSNRFDPYFYNINTKEYL